MSEVFVSSVIWIFCSSINILSCFMCLWVFYKSSIFDHSSTYTMLRILLINDLFSSMYFCVYQSWHIYNYLFKIPEILSVYQCYKIIAVQSIFYFTNLSLNLAIGFQRLCSVLFPNNSKFNDVKFGIILSIISILISLSIFLSNLLLDTFSTQILTTYCSARTASGAIFGQIRPILILIFSWLTILMYIAAYLKVKMTSKIGPIELASNTPNHIGRKLAKKVGRILSFVTLVYLLISTIQTVSIYVFRTSYPELMITVGQYLAVMNFVDGTMYFVTFVIFIQDFRREIKNRLMNVY